MMILFCYKCLYMYMPSSHYYPHFPLKIYNFLTIKLLLVIAMDDDGVGVAAATNAFNYY